MIKIGNIELSNIKLGNTQVQKMYLGTNLIWEFNSGRLPSGYKELEYIASTKTGSQYIDLNILLYDTLNKNYDIALKFNAVGAGSDNTTQGTIFGCQDNTGKPWPGTFIRVSGTNMVGRYIGGTGKDNTLGKVGTDIELTEKTSPSKNVTNYNNGGQTHTWGTSLFCIFNNQAKTARIRYIEAKLYYFKLFVEGTLVRDMVPCINPSNVVGLYDLVNDVFYSSPNGAAFTAGPEISNQGSGEGGEGGSTESNLVALDYIQAPTTASSGDIKLLFNYKPIAGTVVTTEVSNIVISGSKNYIFTTDEEGAYAFEIDYSVGDNYMVSLFAFDSNGYYTTYDSSNNLKFDGRTNHIISLGEIGCKLDDNYLNYKRKNLETPSATLCLKYNPSIKYHSFTIKKADGNTIVLKPYSQDGKAVLYDETNKVVYAPTGGDYICGNPLS